MEKLFIYDVETTGVQHWRNSIHQLSCLIIINGEVKEELDFKVRPHEKAIIEPEAIAISNVTQEQIMAYPTQWEVYQKLLAVLGKYVNKFDKKDKFHLAGFNNAPFDNQFFRAFFAQNNDKYFGSWFWADTIDLMCLASNFLRHRRHEMENFKLMTVAKHLGIEVDEEKLHDAIYDLKLTYQILNIINGNKA